MGSMLGQQQQQQGDPNALPVQQFGDAVPPPYPGGSYVTPLDPNQKAQFAAWVKNNNVPYDPSPHADYDMPGFWLRSKGQPGLTAINKDDGRIHYPDDEKTPYHNSFSSHSKYAIPGKAPTWVDDHQLVYPNGMVKFDERNSTVNKNVLRAGVSKNVFLGGR